jgi:MFS family permease
MGLNLLINGPFAVGIPVVARTRFPEGAAAFGLVISLFGGGALLGTTLSGIFPKPSKKLLGTVSLSLLSVMGMGLVVIGVAPTMYIAAAATLVMGIANGYANIMLITWLQQKVAPEMMGRIMSLVMFAAIGLNPVSTVLAGALIGINVAVLLVCAGSLMTLFTLAAAFSPRVRMGIDRQTDFDELVVIEPKVICVTEGESYEKLLTKSQSDCRDISHVRFHLADRSRQCRFVTF